MRIELLDGTDIFELFEEQNRKYLEAGRAIRVRGSVMPFPNWMKPFKKLQRRYVLKLHKEIQRELKAQEAGE